MVGRFCARVGTDGGVGRIRYLRLLVEERSMSSLRQIAWVFDTALGI